MWYYYMKCLTERKKKQLKCWVIFKAFFFLLHILWYSCFTSIIDFQFIAGKKTLFLIPSMTTLIVRSLWHIFIANFTLFLINPSSARSLQRLLFLEHNSTNFFLHYLLFFLPLSYVSCHYCCLIISVIYIYQPLRPGRIWHKVNF